MLLFLIKLRGIIVYALVVQTDLFQSYAKKEITRATIKPVPPTSVSITVHVFSVVCSSMPTSDFTNQKPESLKWEHTVAPPAMAAVMQAKWMGESPATSGMAAMIPAAMVMATVAEPTEMRTKAATTKATITIGKEAEATA